LVTMGKEMLDAGYSHEAIAAYSRARKLAPKDGDVLHGLAKAHISLVGDALSVEEEALRGWQSAENVWLEAINLAPSHPELALKKLRLQNYYPFPLGVPASERSGVGRARGCSLATSCSSQSAAGSGSVSSEEAAFAGSLPSTSPRGKRRKVDGGAAGTAAGRNVRDSRASAQLGTGSASVAVRDRFEVFTLSLGRWAFCSKSHVLDHVRCDAIVAEAEVRACR
jgi:hypothetical protein